MKSFKGHIKEIIVLTVEIIYILSLVIKCFGSSSEYILDKNSFSGTQKWKERIVYFENDSVGVETEKAGQCEVMTSSIPLKSGAYKLEVIYDSVSDYDNANIDNSAGKLCFKTENASVLQASDIVLSDGIHSIQSRLWIREMWGEKECDLKISVIYNGYGRLAIKSISIAEKKLYRVTRCIFAILFFLVIDFLIVMFGRRNGRFSNEKKRFIVAGILGITFFSSMTYLAEFLNPGHDLNFHLGRIVSLANGLKEFQIPHRMQFEMLNGYGYATPLYYGEIFLLLPAILYDLYVPLQTGYQIWVVIVNLVTALLGFWCFEKIVGDWRKGLFGAAVYTLSAYRIMDLTVRAAVGEYMAMIFFPLLFYGVWKLYTKSEADNISFGDYFPLIVSVTGIINSHILSCEILTVFIILFMLFEYRITFKRKMLLALVKCGVWIIFLNLWFVIPFVQSMQMKVGVTDMDRVNMIERHGVYLSQLFGIFHSTTGGNVPSGRAGEMPLALGVSLCSGLVLFLIVYIMREKWDLCFGKEMRNAKICLAFGVLAVFLASDLCRWDNLIAFNRTIARLAGMIEFPWRYLAPATLLFTAMTIWTLHIIESNLSIRACNVIMVSIIGLVVLTEGFFMMDWTDVREEEQVLSESDVDMTRFSSSDYLLLNTDREAYKNRDLLYGDGIENAEFHYDKNGRYYLNCDNLNEEHSYVDVPVQAYDHYHAYQSDGQELVVGKGENNRIRIMVPGNYQGAICLRYEVPGLWRVCELISFTTACALFWRMALEWRNRNRREYCGQHQTT